MSCDGCRCHDQTIEGDYCTSCGCGMESEFERLREENAALGDENTQLRAAVGELNVARAAWIHHVNAPAILQKMWAIGGDETCGHERMTGPGVGAFGKPYCIECGFVLEV